MTNTKHKTRTSGSSSAPVEGRTESIARPEWLGDDVWPFTVRTFHHEGRPIHVLDEGEGPTLVFVHAGMWSFVWRDLITELRSEFRCLTLDFPGSGLSAGSSGDVDLGSFSSLLGDWLDELDVRDATLVCHDLGGVVGVTAAATRPDRWNGLVAINTFGWPPHTRGLRTALRVMGGRGATAVLGTLRVIPRMTRSRFGVGRVLDRGSKAAFFGPYRESRKLGRNFHRVMGSAVRSTPLFEASEAALRGGLSHLPVMTVFGQKNDQFGFASMWAERFGDVEANVIDGGNHFPMCDEPELVADWLRVWHAERCRRVGDSTGK